MEGQVLFADHFGNLITNIHADDLASSPVPADLYEVIINNQSVGTIKKTYSDTEPQQPIALFGSTGMLEVSVNMGSAARLFDAGSETPIIVQPPTD